MRLDVAVAERTDVRSRSRASTLVKQGQVTVNGVVVTKPSQDVSETDEIAVREDLAFVGRGGYKLLHALETWSLDLSGKVCLDVGASTGGFTDCMLRHGAAKVYALDVGSGQLDPSLCKDERVVNLEKTDIRTFTPFCVDFVSADVSFISLTKIFPYVRRFLSDGGEAVVLVKPQFEVEHVHLKNGVVRDKSLRARVLSDVVDAAQNADFTVRGLVPSPITGGDGNVEYLCRLTVPFTTPLCGDIKKIVSKEDAP